MWITRQMLPERNKFKAASAVFDSAKFCAKLLALSAALLVCCGNSAFRAAAAAGRKARKRAQFRQQLWLVPSQDSSVLMRTAVFRPSGPGPFPLVIINHGSVQSETQRADHAQPVFHGGVGMVP